MTPQPLLTIDNEPISVGQALRYLQVNRKLDSFIGEIVRQFVLERELRERGDELKVPPTVIEQSIIDFRLQQQLTDPKQFQDWLAQSGTNFEGFHAQVEYSFKIRQLKDAVAQPRLQEHFIERKMFLDRIVISRIIVASQDLAEELKTQLQEGASFEQLARDYSLADDKALNGMVGPVSRGGMPDVLRAAMDLAQPGDIVGPIGVDDRWGLFRLESILPASMDNPQVQQTLQDELFEQWLAEQMQNLPIRLQLGE